jgi:hypothetical protein
MAIDCAGIEKYCNTLEDCWYEYSI